jgi:ribosomal protein S18 acetylase RimI-like enzyme
MLHVRSLTLDDLPLGMRLKDQAKWNQTEADWRRALALAPDGCYVGLCDDVPAATLTTCIFGDVAWIAMVLTDPAFRGRGLATTLLTHALSDLERRGIRSVRLDATALGKPVYEKLGFVVDGGAVRYYGRPNIEQPELAEAERQTRPLRPDDIPHAAQLDLAASGNPRERLLASLQQDWAESCFTAGDGPNIAGFVTARRGSRAAQVGPCVVGRHNAIGPALMMRAFAAVSGPVYVDVPEPHAAAQAFLARCGLVVERTFFRMTRGAAIHELSEKTWANFGPEKG